MASLTKKGKYYYALFNDPYRQKRKWVATGTRDKRVAKQIMSDLEFKQATKQWDPWTDPVQSDLTPLSVAIKSYLKEASHLRKKSQRANASVLGLFSEQLRTDTPLTLIKASEIQSFINHASLAESSRVTYYTRLNTFFKWCVSTKRLMTNPVDGIPRPKQSKKLPVYLKKQEVDSILSTIQSDAAHRSDCDDDAASHWLADVVRVAVGTGLRLSELCHMRWSWIDWDTRSITVKNTNGFKTKNGHERSVYFAGEAFDVLRRNFEELSSNQDDYVFVGSRNRKGDKRHLNPEYVSKRFLHYVRKAGLSDQYHFHTLRHTHASWLVSGGSDLNKVRHQLGHASLSTTMIYAHLSPESIRTEIERVFG